MRMTATEITQRLDEGLAELSRKPGWTCWVLVRLDTAKAFAYETRQLARDFKKLANHLGYHYARVLPADQPCPFKLESWPTPQPKIGCLRRLWLWSRAAIRTRLGITVGLVVWGSVGGALGSMAVLFCKWLGHM